MHKEKENIETRFLKTTTPFEIVSSMTKTNNNRDRILKQLQQLGVEIAEYESMSLQMLIAKTQTILRNTYSVKYLGLNKNQMGVISRRINPFTDKNFKPTVSINIFTQNLSKLHLPEKINVNNLQNEIKKEFQDQKAQKRLILKQPRDGKLRTKMAGSWCGSNSSMLSPPKKKALNANELAKQIMPKLAPTQSFSRFLNKGILIVRD